MGVNKWDKPQSSYKRKPAGHQEETTPQNKLVCLFTPCKEVGHFNTLCISSHARFCSSVIQRQ